MQHIEGNFKGVRNANIYYQAWLPDGDPKATLIIVHGLGEHSGRYGNVVNHLVPLGYAIYGYDHLGHGKSDGEREVVQRFTDYTDTLTAFTSLVKGWQSGKPCFLLGHSMGGLIVTYYLLDHQAEFAGAIISSLAIKVGEDIPPIILTLGKLLSALAPKMGLMGLNASAISRDPDVVQAYINDPLVFHGKTPARLAAELVKAIQRLDGEMEKISLPFIVVQAELDKLVDPAGAKTLYQRASSKDKTLKIYPQMHHEVFNDPERLVALKDVETWLAAHS